MPYPRDQRERDRDREHVSTSGSASSSSSYTSTSPANPPNTASTSVTTPSSKSGPPHHSYDQEPPPVRTPHKSITRSRKVALGSSQKKTNSQSPYNNTLEYYTNNSFSRSFNSLILDDIKDETTTKKKINKSPPFNIKQDLNDKMDSDIETEDEDDYKHRHISHSQKPHRHFTHIHKKSEDLSEEDVEKSQQSSIKRSSKFLNLSIDSNLRTMSRKVSDEIDYISDLNEIDSSIIKPSSASMSREPTPIDNSSPIRHAKNNKFKRPHKLVSQSPSPSSNKVVQKVYQKKEDNHSTESLDYYSPSKVGRKGFKMFKNGDTIVSPNRSTPERRSIFDRKQVQKSSNKLRKTSLNYNKSPFRQSSSPIANNFEYYNIDDMDFDSPSRNRKLSNGSNSIVIYQDDPMTVSAPVSTRKVKAQVMSPISAPHYSLDFDDKENKSSYRFVKPLQTAFKSTGLVKKNSIPKESRKLPPETPIKKNPLMLINTNKSSLSNIISSAHEEGDDSEMSIEVGRNISAYNSTLNESNSSFFRIPSTNNSSQKTTHLNILNNADLDIDLSSDIEIIPETPTKSVKKSHSTPANFSPVSFNKHRLNSYIKNTNKLSISTASLDSSASSKEPSTPTNLLHKSILPSKNHSDLHHQLLDTCVSAKEEDDTITNFKPEEVPHTQEEPKKSKLDDHLVAKFGRQNIKYIGAGEFSIAYECLFQDQKLAIKRSKRPVVGKSERKAIMREIEALRALTSVEENEDQDEGKEYLVYFIEAWDFNNYYYIMTEYCDNGTLFDFLEEHKNYKMDEFRTWKILIEILSGLSFIHSKNYLHLDLKPANIFITFEGSLKIGDFGLTTKLPILEKDFDLEGDRNYIAPELINDKIYTPFADIFSLGLIVLEIAANIVLPDNGTPWRKLRSGDLSDAGKLSSDNISDFLQHQNFSSLTSYNTNNMNFSSNQSMNLGSSSSNHTFNPPPSLNQLSGNYLQQPATTSARKGLVPHWAPDFLVSGDSMKLDKLVNKMLRPNPFDRPNARMILAMEECSIVENRRKAGATIFEGEFGPSVDEDEP